MPQDVPIDLRLKDAGILIRSGRPKDAVPILDSVLAIEPTHLWALAERGRAKAFSGDHAGAIDDFSERIRQSPNDPKVYTDRAFYILERVKDFPGAINDYSSAIALNPEHQNAFFRRGMVKVKSGDPRGAIDDFTCDIQYAKDDLLSCLLNRGKAKHMIGDLEGALSDLTEAMKQERLGPVFALLYRGQVRMTAKDYSGAISDFSTAIQSYPALTNAHRHRAEARELIGDRIGAEKDRAQYLRLGGQDLEAYK